MSEESIFASALAIPSPSARSAYLDRACAGNPDLRFEVEALLAAHATDNPLDRPPADLVRTGPYEPSPIDDPPAASIGDRIGPYRLMEQIGEGGFGLVFVAEQAETVRRKVALKVLKPGMDTRDVVARFEAERQALALMDHPNIAKVFDAGSTSTGRPYFVMELVRGKPITDYCDQNKLPPRQRLELFVQVCQAVQHAHQKGIIHRDLKPSNILVAPHDGVPVVKVIDFGVAKALGQSLTEKTIYTRFAQMIGTPLYMSPEQAEINQLDVDTRADVYALGVLLYELLTSTTPFDRDRFRKAAFDEIRRIIREEEPPRPSTRLSTLGATLSAVSANRMTEPGKLAGVIRGELDWIVMRCLEKDRNRRYETATGLASDVQRYLAGEAVEACPPTMGYRLRKIFHKNRAAVSIAASFAAVLLLGSVLAAWQAVRATRAEAEAAWQRDEAVEAREIAATDRDQVRLANDSLRQLAAEQRRVLYATSMNLAQAAWDGDDPARTFELLSQWTPKPGEDDLRGFEWHYWSRLAHQEIKTTVIADLAGAGADPAYRHGARLSPDGRLVAAFVNGTGESGTLLTVWDAESGRVQWRIPVDADPGVLPYIEFSLNCRRLVTLYRTSREKDSIGASTRHLQVWDVNTARSVFTFDGALRSYPSLSADGSRLVLVSGSAQPLDLRFSVYQLPDGRELFRYPPDGEKVYLIHAAITADGKRVAASCGGGLSRTSISAPAVRMWEIEDGRELWSTESLEQRFVSIRLSPDGRRIAVPSAGPSTSNSVVVLDGRTGERVATLSVPGWSGSTSLFCPVAFDSSGERLAVRQGAEVHLFAVAPTRPAFWEILLSLTRASTLPVGIPPLRTIRGHAVPVWDAAVVGPRMMTIDRGGILKQWDLDARPNRLRMPFGTPVQGAGVIPSPDGSRIVILPSSVADHQRARFTDGTGRPVGSSELPPGRPRERAFSADGRRFVAVWQEDPLNGRIPMVVWDGRTGQELARRDGPPGYLWNTLAVSPDGSRIAAQVLRGANQSEPHRLIVWEPATGREVCSRGIDWFVVPTFTVDGQRLISTDAGPGRKEARFVWLNPETGEELKSVPVRNGLLNLGDTIDFSQDGARMATFPAWTAEPVRVWDFEALECGKPAQPLFTIAGHGSRIRHVAFSPDKRRLLTTSPGLVKLWDGSTGRELLTLKAPGVETDGAYFSPDGHTIWAGLDENGRLWGWDGAPLG